jgi:hypothetical protein
MSAAQPQSRKYVALPGPGERVDPDILVEAMVLILSTAHKARERERAGYIWHPPLLGGRYTRWRPPLAWPGRNGL